MTYTPGPWRRSNGNIGNAIEAYSGKKSHEGDNGFRTVAMFQDCCASPRYDEQQANFEANARLIAAAPDLLAALCNMLVRAEQVFDHSALSDEGEAIAVARAAIAKAIGA